MRTVQLLLVALLLAASLISKTVSAHDDGKGIEHSAPAGVDAAGPFSSSNRVQFLSQVPILSMGGSSGQLNNDIWGWTDSQTGHEYALVGRMNGTSFVDVTDPFNPIYVGNLPSHNNASSVWRDIKVNGDHAYIVADGQNHGLQIFDLTALRTAAPGTTFSNTPGDPDNPGGYHLFHHNSFGNAHNIAINEATNFAYVVGAASPDRGLRFLDLANPIKPNYVGAFSADGYTHDTQVVSYFGPDTTYVGKEVAFSSNEDTLTIVDLSNKSAPVQLSRTGYAPHERYTHQGWLSEDHQFFFMNDELDEPSPAPTTRTHIWDVRDLDNATYLGFYSASVTSKDHNLYVHDGLIYAANYTSGLRIIDPTLNSTSGTPSLSEIGFLDTFASNDSANFNGAWSVYPFFDSGTIIVNDRQNGLFLARLLKGDTDNDGDVDNTDMLNTIGNFTGPNQPLAGKRFETGSFDGDGDVDNTDMLTAIGNFTGPGISNITSPGESLTVESITAAGSLIDRPDHANLIYDPLTGNLQIDPSEGAGGLLTGFVLESDNEFIAANHQTHLGGTTTSLASELSEANNSSTINTTIDLGNVLASGLTLADLELLLTTANYTAQSGTGVHELDLVLIPEPSGIALAAVAALLFLVASRRSLMNRHSAESK